MKQRLTIYWLNTTSKERIAEIRAHLNLPAYTSINGETSCDIEEGMMDELREFEKQGLIQIRNKNGKQ